MDDLEGEVADKELHKCALGHDILSADLNGEDSLLLNIGQYCAFGVDHNISRLVCGERVGKVSSVYILNALIYLQKCDIACFFVNPSESALTFCAFENIIIM